MQPFSGIKAEAAVCFHPFILSCCGRASCCVTPVQMQQVAEASANSGQRANDPKLLIFLFLIFIQCHLCTTKSIIKKRPTALCRGKSRPYKASVGETRPSTVTSVWWMMFAHMLMRKSRGRKSVWCRSCWRNHTLGKLQTRDWPTDEALGPFYLPEEDMTDLTGQKHRVTSGVSQLSALEQRRRGRCRSTESGGILQSVLLTCSSWAADVTNDSSFLLSCCCFLYPGNVERKQTDKRVSLVVSLLMSQQRRAERGRRSSESRMRGSGESAPGVSWDITPLHRF